ncbi:hypothetical protein [Streptomyces viridochromogenes]
MQDVIADTRPFARDRSMAACPPGSSPRGTAPNCPATLSPHSDLEPILHDTYGVVIWHEQINAIFARMTGCDLVAGDVARRVFAVGDRLPKMEDWFRRAAAARGYADSVIGEVLGISKELGLRVLPGACRRVRGADRPVRLAQGSPSGGPIRGPAGTRSRHVADAGDRLGRPPPRRLPILPVDVNYCRTVHSVERTCQGLGGARRCPRCAASATRRPRGSRPGSRTPRCRTCGSGRGPRHHQSTRTGPWHGRVGPCRGRVRTSYGIGATAAEEGGPVTALGGEDVGRRGSGAGGTGLEGSGSPG